MTIFNLLGSNRNPLTAKFWLRGASVDGYEYENKNVKEFLLQLEDIGAIITYEDLYWLNPLCRVYLGREFIVGGEKAILEERARAALSYDVVNIENKWDRMKVDR